MVTSNRNITGKAIKFIRVNKGISQYDLANKLSLVDINMDQTIISRVENQTRELLDYELKAIADVLEIKIEDLFNK